jgi:hypothetical protein
MDLAKKEDEKERASSSIPRSCGNREKAITRKAASRSEFYEEVGGHAGAGQILTRGLRAGAGSERLWPPACSEIDHLNGVLFIDYISRQARTRGQEIRQGSQGAAAG